MIALRPYQKEAKKAVKDYYQSGGKRGLVVSATGTGKTVFAVDIAGKFNKVLFIAHREELIVQAYNKFEEEYPFDVGLIKAEKNEHNKKITIASVQTLWKRYKKIPRNLFDLVIVDESHHYMSKTFSSVVLYFDCKLLIGLTATPTRLDGLSMSNIFDKIVFEYPIDKGINDGYLCNINALRIKTDIDLTKVKTIMGDFSNDELSRTVDIPERNKLIIDKYIQYAKGRQAIAFCVDIQHSEHLRDILIENGITSESLSSRLSPEVRREYISKFRNKEIQVLTNCEILTEGFDVADIGCLLMGRPTKSLALYMQMIGRATRLKSESYISAFGKNEAIILDFVDNVGKHKLINCWEIESGKEIEDKVFISKERKDALLLKKEEIEQEKARRKAALIETIYKTDKRIDLLKLPEANNSVGSWQRLAPTEAQIIFLKGLGIYDETCDYTRGQASEIISNQPATDAQIKALARFNYNVINGCTRGQAELAFRELTDKGLIVKKENNDNVRKPFSFF